MSKANELIYLASPYSDPDPEIREERFREAAAAAGLMMQAGLHPFSPISHTHPIALECDLPKGWDFWEQFDRTYLTRCSALWVLTIEGWRESKGVQAEIGIAAELGLPVRYWDGTAEGMAAEAEDAA